VSALRRALVVLLVASTMLFTVGVIAESSVKDEHDESSEVSGEHTESAEAGADTEAGEEGGEEAAHDEGSEPVAHEDEEDERLLGVDLESTPLVIAAVLTGLALAALAASSVGSRRPFLLAVVAIGLGWAALDIREALHQIDESRAGIPVLAAAVAALHLAAAGTAGRLARDIR
jgi:hypothetical protein